MTPRDFPNCVRITRLCSRAKVKSQRNSTRAMKTKPIKIWLLAVAMKKAMGVTLAGTMHILKKWDENYWRVLASLVGETKIWKIQIVTRHLKLSSEWVLAKILAKNFLTRKRRRKSELAWAISKNGKRRKWLRKRKRKLRQNLKRLN